MQLVDKVNLNNVYPAWGGFSVGEEAGTTLAGMSMDKPASQSTDTDVLPNQSPMVTFLVVLGLLLVLMWMANRWGEPGEFSNLRASAYNVLFIALAAIVAIPLIKVAAVKVKGPWTAYILSV